MSSFRPRELIRSTAILSLFLCLTCILSSCNTPEPTPPAPAQSQSQPAPAPEPDPAPVPLTTEELEFFNSNSFFDNGGWGGINIRNQFLTSFYADPRNIDLFHLFYCGASQDERTQEETHEILSDIIAFVPFYPDAGCLIVTTQEMDQVLQEHLGLTLEETNKVGLDTLTYLPQRDLYFHFHGDTNYGHMVHFTAGDQLGDTVRLYYQDTFGLLSGASCVLTLQKTGDSYRFLSNMPLPSN